MNQLFDDITNLWRQNILFRVAAAYLILFVILVLVLPLVPLPYSPSDLDLDQVYQPPFAKTPFGSFRSRHWLGTDDLGRDVLAFTLYGARTAAFISFPVMLLATLAGLFLGTCAGFYGNTGIRTSYARLLVLIISILLFLFLGLYVPAQLLHYQTNEKLVLLSIGILLFLLSLLHFLCVRLFERVALLRKEVSVPLDRLVILSIETFTSIPKLVFILVIASFMPPSVMLLSVILVATFWTEIARLARAEMLKIKHLPYFEAATSVGASGYRLVLYHAFPNLLSPIVVAFIFGLSGLLAFESTLSFLNIGVAADLVSWGKMIAGIKANTEAWWLVVFPGAFLVATVLALQICSYYYLEIIRSRK